MGNSIIVLHYSCHFLEAWKVRIPILRKHRSESYLATPIVKLLFFCQKSAEVSCDNLRLSLSHVHCKKCTGCFSKLHLSQRKQWRGFLRTLAPFRPLASFKTLRQGQLQNIAGVLVNTCACHTSITKSAEFDSENCSRQMPTRNPKCDDMRTKQLFRRQAEPAAQQTRMVNIMEEYCKDSLGWFLSDKPAGRTIWLSKKSSRVKSCINFWFFSKSPEQPWRMLYWMMAIVTVITLNFFNSRPIYPALDVYFFCTMLSCFWSTTGRPKKAKPKLWSFWDWNWGLWCGHFCSMQVGILLSFCQCMVVILGSFEIAWVKLAFKAEVGREQGPDL